MAEQKRFRIVASNRYSNTYEVTADDLDAAIAKLYAGDDDPDVVEVDSDCVGSDIIEADEIIEDDDDTEESDG